MFGIQIAANKNKPILSESIFGEGLLFLLIFDRLSIRSKVQFQLTKVRYWFRLRLIVFYTNCIFHSTSLLTFK